MLVKVLGVFGDAGRLLTGFHAAPPTSHDGTHRHAPDAALSRHRQSAALVTQIPLIVNQAYFCSDLCQRR